MWVLRVARGLTSLSGRIELDPKDVAQRYKQLWMVERTFRTAKSILNTRPVFHQTAAAIRGHMFCSFLALTLQKALFDHLDQAEVSASWYDIKQDLRAVRETEIEQDHKRFAVRDSMSGLAVSVFRAVGLRVPPVIQHLPASTESPAVPSH